MKYVTQWSVGIMTEEKYYFTPQQIAGRLGLCEETIHRAIRSGELGATKIRGRWRIPKESLDAFERVIR